MAEDLEKTRIVYESTEAAIAHQMSSLDEIRSRAGTLVGIASLVTAFLAPTVFSGLSFSWNTAVIAPTAALVFLVLCLGCCGFILLPRKQSWTFILKRETLVHDFLESDMSACKMMLDLSLWREKHWGQNQKILKKMYHAFSLGLLLLSLEVCFSLVTILFN